MRGHKECNTCGHLKPYKDFPWKKYKVGVRCKMRANSAKREQRATR